MKYKYIICIALLLSGIVANAQTLVTPAPSQEKGVLLTGGTAHLGNGQVIENANIGFENGKLTLVAPTRDIDVSNYTTIDITGKHVYPGFILPASDLGLNEVQSFKATLDKDEIGLYNPNVRSIIAYNTDSELIPTMRFNGILLAQIRPYGGIVSGTSSTVQLDAWNWEDAIVKSDGGIFLNWPNRERRQFNYSTFTVDHVPNENYDAQLQMLEQLFSESLSYAKGDKRETNIKLESMEGLFDGSKTLYIQENVAKSMIESVQFAQAHGVQKIVLVGATESNYIKSFLKEHNIPVILNNVHELPGRDDDDVDLPFKLPGILDHEGILVSLLYNGTQSSRNLPFFAGTSAAYGLDKEKALQLITLNAAKILGIDKDYGSLETGKSATLFVSEGDALDMRTNIILRAFIDGREIQLDATQQVLYEKYKKKYEAIEK